MNDARFLVGIDLGTTNSAVAYVDLHRRGTPHPQLFRVPQLVSPGAVQPRDTLPSFVYFPTAQDPGTHAPAGIVGELAREQGALVPARQVSSAKSWLCHPAVDRTAPILPWGAEPPFVSPVEASTRILVHLRDAWNETMAAGHDEWRMERQEIVLTVPASFDQEARELTLEAAAAAGLRQLTLLEEPLAAFYAWLESHPSALRHGGRRRGARRGPRQASESGMAGQGDEKLAFADGDLVLVCDVGGGTTDFTLIRVVMADGQLAFERTAVGEHLLLGGDNLDLALARLLESRLPASTLSLVQRLALRRSASAAKERLLSDPACTRLPITVLGSGRAVVGGAIVAELTRDDAIETLTGGFLPLVPPDAAPRSDRHAALREMGLPYADDPAITRHLAAFLRAAAAQVGREAPDDRQAWRDAPASRPDAVLFNGGFFTPAVARERVLENLSRWFDPGGERRPAVLENVSPAAAVALGAAHFALVRREGGLRVRAGSPRAYYIGLRGRDRASAVCILPRGVEEGTSFDLAGHQFTVMTNRPVSFPLFSSTIRTDGIGALVSVDDSDLHEHLPLSTVLRFGRKSRQVELAVSLSATYTETGTLHVECASRTTDHRWRLQFQLRSAHADRQGGGDRPQQPSPLVEPAPPIEASARLGTASPPDQPADRKVRSTAASPPVEEDEEQTEAVVAEERVRAAQAAIAAVFGAGGNEKEKEGGGRGAGGGDVKAGEGWEAGGEHDRAANAMPPDVLPSHLETTLGFGKQAWPLGVIRPLADTLLTAAAGRRKSARHEARWLNLLGFCLRPGFGAPLDEWRVGQARSVYAEGLAFASDLQCQVEWIVLWQRVAAGLKAGQQRELYQRYSTLLDVRAGRRAPRVNAQVQREAWRLLASLEHLAAPERVKLGEVLLSRIEKSPDNSSYLWSIGRLGARTPARGAVTAVIPPDRAEAWMDRLLSLKRVAADTAAAVSEIGGRSRDPLADISEAARARAMERLSAAGYAAQAQAMRDIQPEGARDALQVFGETLPAGLRLVDESDIQGRTAETQRTRRTD